MQWDLENNPRRKENPVLNFLLQCWRISDPCSFSTRSDLCLQFSDCSGVKLCPLLTSQHCIGQQGFGKAWSDSPHWLAPEAQHPLIGNTVAATLSFDLKMSVWKVSHLKCVCGVTIYSILLILLTAGHFQKVNIWFGIFLRFVKQYLF